MEAMVTDRVASPEFAVVVRGYDRAQVDEYLGELLAWVSEVERRMLATDEANEALQRELVRLRATAASLEERAGVPGPQSLVAFSERMGQVMQSAVAAADELRADTEREANERRDAVAAEVDRMLERAKAEAREILRRARAKERELDESIAALAARRAAAVEELGRLHHQLSDVLSLPEAAPATAAVRNDSTPTPPGPADAALSEEPSAVTEAAVDTDRTPVLASPDRATRALPAAEHGASATPAPTVVQYPQTAARDRRGESR